MINFFVLKYNNVSYETLPQTNGKIIISNNGIFRIGKNVKFNGSLTSNYVGLNKPCTVRIEKEAILSIDDYSGFSGVSIYCSQKIEIGKYVNVGGNVSIWDTDFHPLDYKLRREGSLGTIKKSICIGDDVFIGANSIILKGVKIGNRVIIGAGSVVVKNIPNDEIWAGNPAKFIRNIVNSDVTDNEK